MLKVSLLFASAICCLTFPTSSFAQDIPDSSPNAPYFPEAVKAGPPEAITPGTRLTYFGTSAVVVGQRVRLVMDANGNWVVKDSQKRFETGNSGGVGYTVLRVGHVDHDVAVVSTASYLMDTINDTLSTSGTGGFVSQAGCASVYWIHPDALAKLEDKKAEGLTILRQPYAVNGRKVNAIRIATESEKNYNAQVFDLETGILVFYAASSIGDPTFAKMPDGTMQKVEGSTHTETATLMEAAHVDVPWKDSPAPDWVGSFRAIQYEGKYSANINGAEYSLATSATVTPRARGKGWLRYDSATSTENPGLPASQGTSPYAAGNASIGGLWIPPDGVAALKEGQVIESNTVTRTKTIVARVSDGRVTIRITGQMDQMDYTYDAKSGMLIAIDFQQRTQVGTTANRLKMTGQK